MMKNKDLFFIQKEGYKHLNQYLKIVYGIIIFILIILIINIFKHKDSIFESEFYLMYSIYFASILLIITLIIQSIIAIKYNIFIYEEKGFPIAHIIYKIAIPLLFIILCFISKQTIEHTKYVIHYENQDVISVTGVVEDIDISVDSRTKDKRIDKIIINDTTYNMHYLNSMNVNIRNKKVKIDIIKESNIITDIKILKEVE